MELTSVDQLKAAAPAPAASRGDFPKGIRRSGEILLFVLSTVLSCANALVDYHDVSTPAERSRSSTNTPPTASPAIMSSGEPTTPGVAKPVDDEQTSESVASAESSTSAAEGSKAISFVVPADLCASMGLNDGEEALGMFAVTPKRDCPHVKCISSLPEGGLDVRVPCANCDTKQENWLCLHCYKVLCGRYTNKHMVEHNSMTPEHVVVLSFADLSVWCYACESYLEHPHLHEMLSAAHQSKFGQAL